MRPDYGIDFDAVDKRLNSDQIVNLRSDILNSFKKYLPNLKINKISLSYENRLNIIIESNQGKITA